MPVATSQSASARVTGVLPAPPATRLPTQIDRRRGAVRPRQCPAQPSGGIPRGTKGRQQIGGEPRLLAPENRGGAHHARNERGARARPSISGAVDRAALHRCEPVEPRRQSGEDGVENAVTARGGAGAGGAARGAQPAIAQQHRDSRASSSAPLTVCAAPAAASAAAMAVQLLMSGPCRMAQSSQAASNGL